MDFYGFHGRFREFGCFSWDQVKAWRTDFARGNIVRWVASGKLLRLKRGFYAFPDALDVPDMGLHVATAIYSPSYVSLEWVLARHASQRGLSPQVPLGISPDTGEIMLIGGLPFKGLEPAEFCKGLDEFVGKAEEWRATVEDFRPAAEEAAVRDEEAAEFAKFGANGPGFMSV